MNALPNRQKLRKMIQRLQAEDLNRIQIAEWAFTIINDDNVRITDQTVWNIIKCLGAVDLPSSDRAYLYNSVDFDDWLKKLAE